jgi:uncharacterized membrane protein AbrB (regulator of aidB expression)
MVLLAEDMERDVSSIALLQTMRMISVIALFPFMIQDWSFWAECDRLQAKFTLDPGGIFCLLLALE